MPKQRTYGSYSSYYGREKERRLPSRVPYLVVALVAGAGLAYFHFLAYQSLDGKVLNAYSGAPMPGVFLAVSSAPPPGTPPLPAAPGITATTAPDGSFSFARV